MVIQSRAIYWFSVALIRILTQFFTDLEKRIFTYIETQNTQAHLKEKIQIIKELLEEYLALTSSCTTEIS